MKVKLYSLIITFLIAFGAIFLTACQSNETVQSEIISPFTGPSPWPEIRKERLEKLLPQAMKESGVDAWVIICRENNNDPIAHHIGGENAGGTALFLFYLEGDKAVSKVFLL